MFLTAVIKAVDEYPELLRISVASAGNDLRLGGSEAPPSIISIYLGEELENILDCIATGKDYTQKKKSMLKIGVSALPPIPKDSTDRNRTSPFAFTGNKFEFRMVGSSDNIACPNFILNTIVADQLANFAGVLENAKDFNKALSALIKDTIIKHKRILFSGNNYSAEWAREARKRGLVDLKTTVDALPHFADQKNVEVFERHAVLSQSEINSRTEILLANYSNIVHIEALTALDMARREITPAILSYQELLLKTLNAKKVANESRGLDLSASLEEGLIKRLSALSQEFSEWVDKLEKDEIVFNKMNGTLKRAKYCDKTLRKDLRALRTVADQIELLSGKSFYDIPSYSQILYSVKY